MTVNGNFDVQIRTGLLANNETGKESFALSSPSATYYTEVLLASLDPLASKSNKFIESRVVRVSTSGSVCYILFGDVSIGDASSAVGIMLPPDRIEYITVDTNSPYIRVISEGATNFYITEVY